MLLNSIFFSLITFLLPQLPFNWVSFKMQKRTNKDGKMVRTNANVYFGRKGDMVTHFTHPAEIFLLNNREGELKVYNPEKNSVYQSINYASGSQSTTFYYFLMNQYHDMGLSRMGFKLADTKVDGKLLVNVWEPPKKVDGLDDIELVRNNNLPIFMGYRTEKGEYLKKIFYYNYESIRGINFPMSITEIDYVKKDSIVTKTTFESFQFDLASDLEMLRYEVPRDATLEK